MAGGTTRHFAEELDELTQRLLEMAGMAEERVNTAMRALVDRDRDLIDHVIGGDGALNALQLEIDDRCFKLLALQQPMAGDLRVIVSIVKINADLERVGDLAVNIAEAAERYVSHPPVKTLIDLSRMGELAQRMLRTAIDAFVSHRRDAAREVLSNDDALDALKDQIFRELLTCMLSDPRTIEPGLDLILISRHLERIGDHATNIAEDVIFIVDALDIRHHAADVPSAPESPQARTTL
jgi:phosphate transport system protein